MEARIWVRTLVAALGLSSGSAEALEGRVVDAESGRPLPNVELSIVGGTQSVHSDPEGRFVLAPDPRPPFAILAILPGGRYVGPVTFDRLPDEGPLLVEVSTTLTEVVTVTTGAAPGITSAPANATTTVTRDDLRTRESRNLTETLENVPGVSNVSEGHAAAPAIRGLAQARTLLLIDGARVTAERRVGPSATYLDPFVLEGVEVSRGPGAVAYGSDAFGGVILARTRRPRPGAELGFAVEGTFGAGVPQGRIGAEVEAGLGERAGLLVSAHHRSFDDYESPEGDVLNSGARDTGLLASYGRLVPGGLFSVAVQRDWGRDIERPRTNSAVTRFYYPSEDSLRVTASYESGPVLAFDSTELSLSFGDYRIVTDQDSFATATEPRQIARAGVAAHDFGLRAGAAEHWGQARVDFGLDCNGRFDLEAEDVTIDFDLAGNETGRQSLTTIEDARRLDTGVYVSAEAAVAPVVSLAGGLRFDWVRSTNEGGYFGDIRVSNSEPSGFAAMTLGSFGGFSTSLQYAHGFRDARLSDRFFRGVTGAGFITGNPELEAETSEQYDLALRYEAGRLRPALYVYRYDIADLIERYEDQPDSFLFRNRGSARIEGLELELQAALPARLHLLVAAGIADGEALDDGGEIDDIPPESVVVQARKELGPQGFVQLRGAWFGDLDEPGPNEVALDSHVVVDAAAGWRFAKSFELNALVRNLLDETYRLTPDSRSPLAPGVSALLTAGFAF